MRGFHTDAFIHLIHIPKAVDVLSFEIWNEFSENQLAFYSRTMKLNSVYFSLNDGKCPLFPLMLQAKAVLIGWNAVQFSNSHIKLLLSDCDGSSQPWKVTRWNPPTDEQWRITTKVAWLLTAKPLTWLKFERICHHKQNTFTDILCGNGLFAVWKIKTLFYTGEETN